MFVCEKNKFNNSYLDSVDWDLYLEREQEIFLFTCDFPLYGQRLKEEMGIRFEHLFVYYKDGVGYKYRSKKELEKVSEYFAELIAKKDERIDFWFGKEQEAHKKAKDIYDLKNPKEIIETFQDIFFYNTALSFLLSFAFNKVRTKDVEIKKRLDDVRSKSLYLELMSDVMGQLFEKVAKRYKISKRQASLCTYNEVINILEGKVDVCKDDIIKRESGCYFYFKDNRIVFHYSETNPFDNFDVKYEDVKGKVAFRGKAVGRVKIVNTVKQMSKLKNGDVLVSINTNPALMPAIKKSSAIITNEGRITCHAAIISRELKKPCIIGTKIATQVLKDGDLVEVDANEGFVKLIK